MLVRSLSSLLTQMKNNYSKNKLMTDDLTDEQRDKLIDNYAWRVVDDMDIKDLCQFVAEVIAHDFETETDEYVIEQIQDYYPDLIEEIFHDTQSN